MMDSSYLNYFECPVCMHYFEPPIFQCFNGHTLCKHCRGKLRQCPTCSSRIGNTRNFILEQMVNEIEIYCKNEECDIKTTLQNYEKHEDDCECNYIFPCEAPNCTWEDNIHLLNEHILDNHQSLIVENRSKLKSHQYTVAILKYSNYMFWIRRYIDEDLGNLTWTAQSTTMIDTNEKFVLTVKAYTPDGDYYALSQTCSTDIHEDEESLRANSILHMQRNEAKGSTFILEIGTV